MNFNMVSTFDSEENIYHYEHAVQCAVTVLPARYRA